MPASVLRRGRAPRWRRRPHIRPEQILNAALPVFGAAGYVAARLEDIARGAGVSKATLYLYFESKEAVFHALVRHATRVWLEPEPAAAGFFPESASKKLERILRHVWRALQRPPMPELTRLLSAERAQFPELSKRCFEGMLREIRERLAPVLRAGAARGEFRPEAEAAAQEALPAWLLQQGIHGSASLSFEAGLELLLRGVYAVT